MEQEFKDSPALVCRRIVVSEKKQLEETNGREINQGLTENLLMGKMPLKCWFVGEKKEQGFIGSFTRENYW